MERRSNKPRGVVILGSSLRPKLNGERTVTTGRIAGVGCIHTHEEALRIAKALQIDFPDFDYHVSGTAGNYKIIEYDKERTPSRYID